MSKRKRRAFKEKLNYPIIQGHLKEDSETIICGTGRYKTSFTLIEAKTNKEFLCVYWSNLKKILKGELALVKGMHSAKDRRLFFCVDVRKIPFLYDFEEIK